MNSDANTFTSDFRRLPHPFDRYSVTNTGVVYSHVSGKVMKDKPTRSGYRQIKLQVSVGSTYNGKTCRYLLVHRLVAAAFLGVPLEYDRKTQINHVDGDKTNNFLGNLEVSDASRNQTHALDTGLSSARKTVQCYDENAAIGWVFRSTVQAAKSMGAVPSSISRAARKIKHFHRGLRWDYI